MYDLNARDIENLACISLDSAVLLYLQAAYTSIDQFRLANSARNTGTFTATLRQGSSFQVPDPSDSYKAGMCIMVTSPMLKSGINQLGVGTR
jgi:hypothetical protein